MKALVKSRPEPGLSYEDVPVPEIGRDDVLIKVLRTGVCGTDLHIYAWDAWAHENVPVPLVIGHEFVGRIVELGEDVRDLEVGDLVSGEGHLVCGRCRNCMAGRRVQCARTKAIGVNYPGAYAEYVSLPATNVWRHPADIDLDVAAIFDPFGNAVHTALTFPVLGEDVLDHGSRPDRDHGRHRRPPRRRPLRRHHRRLRLSPRARPLGGRHARGRRLARQAFPRRCGSSG